jgi:hypothetical protein
MLASRLVRLLATCVLAACAPDVSVDWRGKPCDLTPFPEAGDDPARVTGLSFCADSAAAYGVAIVHMKNGDIVHAPVTRGQWSRAVDADDRADWQKLQAVFLRSMRLQGRAPDDAAAFADAVFLVLLDWGGAYDCLQAHSARREAAARGALDPADSAIAAACADDGAVIAEAERARALFRPR